MWLQVERLHVGVGDRHASPILVGVQYRFYGEAGLGAGVCATCWAIKKGPGAYRDSVIGHAEEDLASAGIRKADQRLRGVIRLRGERLELGVLGSKSARASSSVSSMCF